MRTPFLLLVAGAALLGQTVVDRPLPPGMPSFFEGPTFAGPTACAVATRTSIHAWTGLPSAGRDLFLTLPPALHMAAPWLRLRDDLAGYPACGPDLLDGTADDELVLVEGLPADPRIVPTGLPFPGPDLVPVGRGSAVLATAAGWHVLRHAAHPVRIDWVAAPQPLAAAGRFLWGAASDDAFMGIGSGQDGVAGTADDRLVVLRGIASGAAEDLWVQDVPLLPVAGAEGFAVSTDGVGALWRPLSLPAFEVVLIDPEGPYFAPLIVSTPANCVSPYYAPPYGLVPTPDGGFDVWNGDEGGPGRGHVLVDLDAGAPVVHGSWYDDDNVGGRSTVLSARDVARDFGAAYHGFWYVRLGASGEAVVTSREPQNWFDLSYVRPNARTLVVFGCSFDYVLPDLASITVVLDAFRGDALRTFAVPGRWVGRPAYGGGVAPRVFAMGAGRAAGFLRTATAPGDAPDVLRIVSLPTASVEADAHPWGPCNVLSMTVAPGSLGPGRTATVTLATPLGPPAAVWLAIATERAWPEEPGLPFDGLIHLDLPSLLGVLPVPLVDGAGVLELSGTGLPPELDGQPFWLQPVVTLAPWSYLGDLGLVVFG